MLKLWQALLGQNMETISASLAICEVIPPVDYCHKRTVMQSFYDFFLILNKLFNKQPSCQWFEMP